MTLLRCLQILAVAGLISGCASSTPSRKGALALHQALGKSRVIERFPDEYRSFITTIARAETLAERGESLQSENVYRLALLKGHSLTTRATEPELIVAPAKGVPARLPSLEQSMEILPVSPVGATLPDTVGEAEGILTPKIQTKVPPGAFSPAVSPQPLPREQGIRQTELAPETMSAGLSHVESLLPLSTLPGEELPMADMRRFIGNRGYYTVKRGDSLKRVGARLGVDWRHLAKSNGLVSNVQLQPGQIIAYDNRKIVPTALRDGLVINIADRTLYLLKNGAVEYSYPVAVGKPPHPDDDEDWTTPTGRFIITTKAKDPIWRVPQSIQDEMEQHGREPIKEVAAGKGNPLGKYAMKTSLSGILIHSTNSPSSVYSYASHGCIRVMPEHMEKLFPVVQPRTSGIIVYQPVKLAVSLEGRVFLEVNGDVYGRFSGNLESEVRKLVSRRKVETKVDWTKVARVLKKKSGIPEEITREHAGVVRPKPAGGEKTAFAIPVAPLSPL